VPRRYLGPPSNSRNPHSLVYVEDKAIWLTEMRTSSIGRLDLELSPGVDK
jgi:hypothetical protein